MEDSEISVKKILGIAGAVVGGIILMIVLFRSFAVVSAGHVGVRSVFGNVEKEPFMPGFHVKPFWVSVHSVNTQLQPFHDEAQGASKDLQVVTTQITLQFSQVAALAPELYNNIGEAAKIEPAILKPAIQESVKAVTARYTAEELVTHRQQVKLEVEQVIKDFIKTTLEQKQVPGALDVANMAITDFKFSDEFNRAIDSKVKMAQLALQAENKKKETITNAEAQAESVKKNADADAFKIRQEAAARAKAIELEGEQLRKNPNIIQLRATEKWNGKPPVYVGGQQSIPFVGDVVQGQPKVKSELETPPQQQK
jgi:regulator of protease activity HflC (stomatin/prohibitin superfamily)